MSLCLANVDEEELRRFLLVRLRWVALMAGSAALLVVLAGSLAATVAPGQATHPTARPLVTTLSLVVYVVAAGLCLLAVGIWAYSRVLFIRALRDRLAYPTPVTGIVRGLIEARAGGWPVLLRAENGRWLWLTGADDVLRPIRSRRAGRVNGRPLRISVTLLYYPKSRVIREITGMKVEVMEARPAWQAHQAHEGIPEPLQP